MQFLISFQKMQIYGKSILELTGLEGTYPLNRGACLVPENETQNKQKH